MIGRFRVTGPSLLRWVQHTSHQPHAQYLITLIINMELWVINIRNRQQTTLTGHPSQEVQSTIILIFYPNWCRCLHRTHGAQEPVCLSVGAARLVRVFCLISAGLQSPAWLATVSWDVCFADWSPSLSPSLSLSLSQQI